MLRKICLSVKLWDRVTKLFRLSGVLKYKTEGLSNLQSVSHGCPILRVIWSNYKFNALSNGKVLSSCSFAQCVPSRAFFYCIYLLGMWLTKKLWNKKWYDVIWKMYSQKLSEKKYDNMFVCFFPRLLRVKVFFITLVEYDINIAKFDRKKKNLTAKWKLVLSYAARTLFISTPSDVWCMCICVLCVIITLWLHIRFPSTLIRNVWIGIRIVISGTIFFSCYLWTASANK